MLCRFCSSKNTRVICTDHFPKFTKRYCRCLDCGNKYRTIEYYEDQKPGPAKGTPRPGQIARGSSNGSSIFTDADIYEMRQLYKNGSTLSVIASTYGISSSYVSRIVNRKVWTHLK